jgi:aminoglycoside phosphotransferase (APT) family kinase protein
MRFPLLNSHYIVGYLAERGLLNVEDAKCVTVSEVPRRNHNLSVCIDGVPRWFVKQIRDHTPEVVASLRREAACYHIARQNPKLAPLNALMPQCDFYDAEYSILVIEHLRGVNAAEAHLATDPFDLRIAGLLGHSIAVLHGMTAAAVASPLRTQLQGRLPWPLVASESAIVSSRRSRLLTVFAEPSTATSHALAALRKAWQRDSFIHGDTRLENFMLCRPLNDHGDLDMRVVDWELADIGDAAWDCAGVLQHYWLAWLNAGSGADTWPNLRAAIESFWNAYGGRSGSLRRTLAFTGARLIQTAYEHAESQRANADLIDRLGRAAALLLVRPDEALKGFQSE